MGESEAGEGTDRGPDDSDLSRWRERQQRLSEIHTRGTAQLDAQFELRPIARDLAELLWSFHDDGQLWKQLRSEHRTLEGLDGGQRVRLLAAGNLDWTPFLVEAGYRPPPQVEVLADEFRRDMFRAIDNPQGIHIRALRDRVADLATRLDQTLADERPGVFAKLGSYLRLTLPVAARAALVNGAAAAGGLAAGAAVTATVAGIGVGPVAAAVAGSALRVALDRALPEWSPEDRPQAGRTADEVTWTLIQRIRPGEAGMTQANLRMLSMVAAERPDDMLWVVAQDAGMEPHLQAAIEWIDRSLGALFIAWEQTGTEGKRDENLERLVDRLTGVRRILADIGLGGGPLLGELADGLGEAVVAVLSDLPPGHGQPG
ncbi:hypothetical protein [Kribbella sp. VKM Ac-2566]|uniref:hypothetical protein n=1 Tax=Kribbella sp. VKM Ac-2566 TaxID=2512218 RepID=UPI0010644E60|nr:hypothetical protein [Kribbella sp. VKM Ac-2566]